MVLVIAQGLVLGDWVKACIVLYNSEVCAAMKDVNHSTSRISCTRILDSYSTPSLGEITCQNPGPKCSEYLAARIEPGVTLVRGVRSGFGNEVYRGSEFKHMTSQCDRIKRNREIFIPWHSGGRKLRLGIVDRMSVVSHP